jgi:hypothetical protein
LWPFTRSDRGGRETPRSTLAPGTNFPPWGPLQVREDAEQKGLAVGQKQRLENRGRWPPTRYKGVTKKGIWGRGCD